MLQKIALRPFHDFEAEAIVQCLAEGHGAGAGPFYAAQIRVNHHDPVPQVAGVGELHDAIEHGLRVFTAGTVTNEEIVAVKSRYHDTLRTPPLFAYRGSSVDDPQAVQE